MDPILTELSSSLAVAKSIDQQVRPLLDMLGKVTGMESTYLTEISLSQQEQRVQFARNVGEMTIPEGLTVTWEDTLCKRALESGQLATSDACSLWPDSSAARQLGIQSYVSAPIRSGEGDLLGTMCAASTRQIVISTEEQSLFQLFAQIVANFIERELLVEKLRAANDRLSSVALSDELTGLPNRRALFDELERLLAQARRSGHSVLVGVIDLDGFKQINDVYGHQIGDVFLLEVARRLLSELRSTDMVGRLGGDEFLFLGLGSICLPTNNTSPSISEGEPWETAQGLQQRLTLATAGAYELEGLHLQYAGASVGLVAIAPGGMDCHSAIQLADAEMYVTKRMRKQA